MEGTRALCFVFQRPTEDTRKELCSLVVVPVEMIPGPRTRRSLNQNCLEVVSLEVFASANLSQTYCGRDLFFEDVPAYYYFHVQPTSYLL